MKKPSALRITTKALKSSRKLPAAGGQKLKPAKRKVNAGIGKKRPARSGQAAGAAKRGKHRRSAAAGLALRKPGTRIRNREALIPLLPPPEAEGAHAESVPDPPDLQAGVNLIGFIRTEIGVGEACRSMAETLEIAGVPFGIMNYKDPGAGAARNKDTRWIHKEREDTPYRINLFHMNADSLKHAYDRPIRPLNRDVFRNRFNIGYWAWELPEFPDKWLDSFKLVDEVWVPSRFVEDALQPKSPVPVVKIPHAVFVKHADAYDRSFFGLPEKPFLFLTMYDTHSTKERKNPLAVIRAFKKAFPEGSSNAALVIKINNSKTNPEDVQAIRQQVEGYSNIHIIDRILSRDQVNALLQSADCLVSLHRSEGFGLVLAEAMYLGKPVIGTNWSGNTDFMNKDNSCPVNYKLVQVGQDAGPYQADQLWAEPDIEHAAYYMRKLAAYPSWGKSLGVSAMQTIREEYSPEAVGRQVMQRLTDLELL